jgi:Flp pilus assembly protein, protease CpaA
MHGGLISYALLAALATALLYAATTDLRRREIDNWLNAAVAAGAPVYWLTSGLGLTAIAFQIGLALVTFLVACGLFAARQMGGGDVKLLTALALWFVPGSFAQVLALMILVGGAASIALAVYNMGRLPGESLRDGVATGAAMLWVLILCAIVFGLATGRPLIDAQAAQALLAWLPKGWLLAVIGLLLLALIVVGLRHIFRRQQGAIAIPYGVAIAGAGLWVIGQSALATPLAAVSFQ